MGTIVKVESKASVRKGKGVRWRADWRDPQGLKRSKTEPDPVSRTVSVG